MAGFTPSLQRTRGARFQLAEERCVSARQCAVHSSHVTCELCDGRCDARLVVMASWKRAPIRKVRGRGV